MRPHVAAFWLIEPALGGRIAPLRRTACSVEGELESRLWGAAPVRPQRSCCPTHEEPWVRRRPSRSWLDADLQFPQSAHATLPLLPLRRRFSDAFYVSERGRYFPYNTRDKPVAT